VINQSELTIQFDVKSPVDGRVPFELAIISANVQVGDVEHQRFAEVLEREALAVVRLDLLPIVIPNGRWIGAEKKENNFKIFISSIFSICDTPSAGERSHPCHFPFTFPFYS